MLLNIIIVVAVIAIIIKIINYALYKSAESESREKMEAERVQEAQRQEQIEKDFEANYSDYLKKAESGDSNAQYEIGKNLIKKDYLQAVSWLYKAIENGNQNAQEFLEENRKYFYFFLHNDTAWNITNIQVIIKGENTHNWQGCFQTRSYDALIFSYPKELCGDEKLLDVTVNYNCKANNMSLSASEKESVFISDHMFYTEKEAEEYFQRNRNQPNQYLIYSKYMYCIDLKKNFF